MIDRQLPRAWPPDALERRIVAALRLRTFASRRPRSRRYSQYRRSLRPCAARFATAQDITELSINHLEWPQLQDGSAPAVNPWGSAAARASVIGHGGVMPQTLRTV